MQKANVRALYIANLKAKMFRFLHASNIEFIQHFVKVENYMDRRKMRNAVRVLFKFAKIQQAQSSFSKVPTPKAIHMIHLWLSEK